MSAQTERVILEVRYLPDTIHIINLVLFRGKVHFCTGFKPMTFGTPVLSMNLARRVSALE